MAAVEVPQTTSHLGISKHDRFSKKSAVSGDGHSDSAQLADQIDLSPLSQKEKFGESKIKFQENGSIIKRTEDEMNEEACVSGRFDSSHVKVEPSSTLNLSSSIQECVENSIR